MDQRRGLSFSGFRLGEASPPAPSQFETEVFPALLDQGVPVRVHQVRAPFLDIGTPESLAQAGAFVRENQKWFSLRPESA